MQRTENLQTLLDNEAGRGREGESGAVHWSTEWGGEKRRKKPPAKTATKMMSENGSGSSSNKNI